MKRLLNAMITINFSFFLISCDTQTKAEANYEKCMLRAEIREEDCISSGTMKMLCSSRNMEVIRKCENELYLDKLAEE